MNIQSFFKGANIFFFAAVFVVIFQSTSFANKHNIAESKRYFKQGQSYFENQQYAEALASFQMAFHYKKLSGFYFNMAQCQMELGEYKAALKNYQAYLDKRPNASNLAMVKQRILEAQNKLGILPPKARATRAKLKTTVPKKKVAKKRPKIKKAKATAKLASKSSKEKLQPAIAATANTSPPELALIPLITSAEKQRDSKSTTGKKTTLSSSTQPATSSPNTENQPKELTQPNLIPQKFDSAPSSEAAHSALLATSMPGPITERPLYEEWWFWSVTGTVVAASVGAIVYATSNNSAPLVLLPSGSLGRIDRR